MQKRNLLFFGGAMFLSALAGSLVGPRPALAVAREIIELQRDVTTLLEGQKSIQTQMTQDHTVQKTLIEQSSDNVNRLGATMSSLEKSVQDVQANSGARLDTMSTQVQGLSDNLEEIKSRLGKVNQQLVDLQCSVQNLDSRSAGGGPSAALPRFPHQRLQPIQHLRRALRILLRRTPRLRALRLPPIRCIPTACATSPAANTIWPAPNFRIISSITATPTLPPMPSFTSAKLRIRKSNTTRP
jgi:hypothetical protein